MKLTLSPMRRDDDIVVSKSGDVLTINGEAFDFSEIPDGATLPQAAVQSEWLASDVTRENGMLCLSLILPHGASAPMETLFPEPIVVASDGPVELPPSTVAIDEDIQ